MPGKGSLSSFRHAAAAVLPVLFLTFAVTAAGPAHALTDLEKTQPKPLNKNPQDAGKDSAAPEGDDEDIEDGKSGMPMPDSLLNKPGNKSATDDADDKPDQPAIPVEIILDTNQLPEPVKKLRVAIVEAAASGDIERLRPLLSTGPDPTQIAVGDAPDDPIAALKSVSGDDHQGREVLGILLDIISTGAARVDKGTPEETYVWPYFAEKPLNTLTPPELVELYRIVTAADVDEMKQFGGYNFYRLGISPDGKWKFFVAGD